MNNPYPDCFNLTEFDKTLIEKAKKMSRWSYRDIDVFKHYADTEECRVILDGIKFDYIDSIKETL